MAYEDLTRRAASNKIFCDKVFKIAKNSKFHGYQRPLASIVYKFLDKKFLPYVEISWLMVLLKMKIYQTKN